MKRLITVAACAIFLVLLFQGVAVAQQASSGDRKLDGWLKDMNRQGEQDPEGFVRHLSETYGIPHEEIRQAREQHRLTYGDTYMAAAIAKQSQKRVGDVAAQFKQQGEGQGWGVVAEQNGVKPGSPQFHQLKTQAKGSVSKLKAQNRHRMRVNEQNLDQEKRREENQGEGGQGQGQGKGQGKGKGQGQGKGQGKGPGGKK